MRSRAQIALSVLTWIAILSSCKIQASGRCGINHWKCGNICIPTKEPCHCGGVKIQYKYIQNEEWCCSEKPCTSLGEYEKTGDPLFEIYGWSKGGNCSSGKVLHLSQPCQGMCNDEYSTDPCPTKAKNSSVNQCILQGDVNDKLFTCLNRADENPFSLQTITDLDLSDILTKCTMGPGKYEKLPGLACPNTEFSPDNITLSRCLPYFSWCYDPIYCGYGPVNFLASDPQICKNASFWQEHTTCGHPKLKRCNGNYPGRCILLSDSEETCDADLPDQPSLNQADRTIDLDILLPLCIDVNSNRTLGLRCPASPGGCLDILSWCQKKFLRHCGYGIVTTDPKICRNMTFWENVPCPIPWHRCNGDWPGQCASGDQKCLDGSDELELLPPSGLDPSREESDCGEKFKCKARQALFIGSVLEESFTLVIRGDEVCLDEKLICDLHPQCQGGEDELMCDESYLEKKIFTKDQTFICPNPYHELTLPDGQTKRLFTHRAIRCNANPECWGGEDEEGCNVIEAIAQYVIRKFSLKLT